MRAQPSQDSILTWAVKTSSASSSGWSDNPELSLAAKEIVAFANSEGGTLYLGVDDDGSVVGVDDADAAFQTLVNICPRPFASRRSAQQSA